jgi:hypothetical protein
MYMKAVREKGNNWHDVAVKVNQKFRTGRSVVAYSAKYRTLCMHPSKCFPCSKLTPNRLKGLQQAFSH